MNNKIAQRKLRKLLLLLWCLYFN